MSKATTKSVFSDEEPAEGIPISTESDKKTNSTAAAATPEKKIMMITVVTRERQKVMNTYLSAVVKIHEDKLPGKEDRLQIVHKFADHDARTRQ